MQFLFPNNPVETASLPRAVLAVFGHCCASFLSKVISWASWACILIDLQLWFPDKPLSALHSNPLNTHQHLTPLDIFTHLAQVVQDLTILSVPIFMRGLIKRQRQTTHRDKLKACSLLQWKTRVRGWAGKGNLCSARQPGLASSHCRMSVTDSSVKERTPKGEMPADNLLVRQPSLEVCTHTKRFHVVFNRLHSPSGQNPCYWHFRVKRVWLCVSIRH